MTSLTTPPRPKSHASRMTAREYEDVYRLTVDTITAHRGGLKKVCGSKTLQFHEADQ